MNREIEIKTERIVELLYRENLGGLLLNGQHNFAWMTGGASNAIDRSRDNGAASILITRKGERFLFASSIEMPRLVAEVISQGVFEPVEYPWQDEKASATFLTEKAATFIGGEIATDIPLNTISRSIDGSVAACRFSLTEEELVRYRVLGKDAASAFDAVIGRLRPRMTELAIAEMIRHEMASRLIESVVTLVAIDERIRRFRHPVPTRKGLGHTVLLVACAKRSGLIASLSRMVSFREASAELKERTEACAFVNARLLAATQPGAIGAELYDVAKNAYEAAGFDGEVDKHHQGGAAGYRTRDWVSHPASSEVVSMNQAFAWNPSITGTKVEDTVLVSADGVECITASPAFPSVSHKIGGREYHAHGILTIDQ